VWKMKVFGLAVAAVLLCLSAREAPACSCGEFSVRQKFRSSDAVFVGRVVELTPFGPTKEFPLAMHLVRFEVERRWKGARGREVTAVADFDSPGMCGDLKLEVGGRYLIYAPSEKGRLRVYADCGPNLDLKWKEAAGEMKRLDSFWLRAKARLYPYPRF
jgi:hypothetical protein